MLDFELVSDYAGQIIRRGFELTTPAILDPNDTNPLVLGEWLELNSTGVKMLRGAVDGATVPSWPVFAEKGRMDVQALKKTPILWMGMYEFDTKVMLGTNMTIGGPVMVGNVTYGGLTRRGLKNRAGAEHIVGRVVRLPADNNGFARVLRIYT